MARRRPYLGHLKVRQFLWVSAGRAVLVRQRLAFLLVFDPWAVLVRNDSIEAQFPLAPEQLGPDFPSKSETFLNVRREEHP